MAAKKKGALDPKAQKERRQMMTIVILCIMIFSIIMAGVIWFYTSSVKAERQTWTEEGIKALSFSNYGSARTLFKQADSKGETYASEFLAWMLINGGHYAEGYKYALRANSLGRLSSYEDLGDLAIINIGQAKGVVAAISYFEQGALAMANEQAKRIESGIRNDPTTNWYTEPLQADGDKFKVPEDAINKRAIELFSGMVQRGLPLVSSEDDYADYIFRAVRKGATGLDLEMGDMLFVGSNKLSSNAQSAVEYWKKAQELGRNEAIIRLAGAYWHGYAVPRDPRTAIELYTRAASNNDPIALYALALISLRQAASLPNANPNLDAVAIQLLSKASGLGYGPASSVLGVLSLTESQGTDAASRAAQWLKVAAIEQHDIAGRILYDLLLMSGTGVKKDFNSGFDDLILVADAYPPAKSIVSLLQKRVPPERIMRQVMVLSNQIIRGNIAYREGDPIGTQELRDPVTNERIERPFSFYESVDKMPDSMKNQFGRNNFTSVTDLKNIIVNGEKILSPDLAKVIIQYAPSTAAKRFAVSDIQMPRPLAPRVPSHYRIPDFVPPMSLVTPMPLKDPNDPEKYTQLFR